MNDCLNRFMNERIDDWTIGCMTEWMNEWMNEWMDEWMHAWVHE